MDDSFLYRRIAEDIRQEILTGKLQPGDRLPSIRTLVRQWDCTPGTIQRAYQELSRQGLVISQAGKGTHVSDELNLAALKPLGPLRRAGMVHRAEAFLLEAITLGYELEEVQQAMDLARAQRAAEAGADYVAFGSFFASTVKPNARRAGLDLLASAGPLGLPRVAIGGITLDNAPALVEAGADALAVISAVFASGDPAQIERAARGFAALFVVPCRP